MSNLAISYTGYLNTEEIVVDSTPSASYFAAQEDLAKALSPKGVEMLNIVQRDTTTLVSDEGEEKKSTETQPSIKTRVVESLENEFLCVIDSVDYASESVDVSVYDIKDKVQVLEISSHFNEFLPTERDKIRPNASFYWRVGSRTVTSMRNDGKEYSKNSLFSEFRMRLNYVSRRALQGRLESRVAKYSELFS
ncbi:TPA: hypothetical protein ACMDO2_000706 [Vibrio parahaemolyticus]|uniref:hypothetical protein n=1 Tax=Vibrio parahaemolyticus TaxID=670 RepID=UPI0011234AE4|nr:hypothetical protein [Vibrio parahaemolyticus]EKA7379948.1 hypothetical protein [Vibrio parahaemolyticus]TOK17794.1 hypothetical protein CGI23_25090 [Vibrio parahaemolyticus]TPA19746.1 hypothetical protein DXJ84_25210 [Vibrio parahaemolyticus]HCG5245888.1 hypothetical protein [Vibrio parahaemolyticus]